MASIITVLVGLVLVWWVVDVVFKGLRGEG